MTPLTAAPAAEPDIESIREPRPASGPVAVSPALTEADAARIAAAISAARTDSTRRLYAYTWGQWTRWCAARGLSPLPR